MPPETSDHHHYPKWITPFLFVIGLVYTFIYWLVGVSLLLLVSVGARLFLDPSRRLDLGYRSGRIFFKGFFGGLTRMGMLIIRDEALSPYCEESEPRIIATNHPALWDAPLLLRRFPRISGIMKAEILNNPILKGGSQFIGFLPNRPSLTMIRAAKQRLDNHGQLLLFPEGTRTRPEHTPVNPFQPGLGFISKQTNIPVLPVFIFMDSTYLQKGWPIWKIPPMPISVSIQVGELQQLQKNETSRAFSNRMEAYFQSALQLKNPWKHQASQ